MEKEKKRGNPRTQRCHGSHPAGIREGVSPRVTSASVGRRARVFISPISECLRSALHRCLWLSPGIQLTLTNINRSAFEDLKATFIVFALLVSVQGVSANSSYCVFIWGPKADIMQTNTMQTTAVNRYL